MPNGSSGWAAPHMCRSQCSHPVWSRLAQRAGSSMVGSSLDLCRLSGACHWFSAGTCLHRTWKPGMGTDFRSAGCRSADPRRPLWFGRHSCESMQDVFDFWWIIYATIAVVIFVKLRSVLGQRTGRERPPYDPFSARDTLRPSTTERPSTNDNVVALPGRTAEPIKPVEVVAAAVVPAA